MRLIDADAYKEKLVHEINKSGEYTPYECGLDDAVGHLADQPTVNAVEVVRCYECQFSAEYRCKVDSAYKSMKCMRREHYSEGVDEFDYCSYGVRRESE